MVIPVRVGSNVTVLRSKLGTGEARVGIGRREKVMRSVTMRDLGRGIEGLGVA